MPPKKAQKNKPNGKKAQKQQQKAPKPKKNNNNSKKGKSSKSMGMRGGTLAAGYGQTTQLKQFSQQSVVISGCDLLDVVNVVAASGPTTGSGIIGTVDMNPASLVPGGRLSQFADLFDKYQYLDFEIIFITNVGTQTSGCLQIAADPDPLDSYSGIVGNALSQALVGTCHNMEVPIYQNATLKIKDKRFFSQPLYINQQTATIDGLRWSSCGKIWIASMGPLAAATSYGRLFVKYKIRFSEPSNDADSAPATAMIGTNSGSYISATYPWGDYSKIQSDYFVGGTVAQLFGRPFVTFRSDVVLGSTIQFNAKGFYYLSFYRTGAAMGTGAFTSAVLGGGISFIWPANDSSLTSYSFAIANGGSTASSWGVIVYVSLPGATISRTSDSGVTHTGGWTWVSKMNITIPTDAAQPGPMDVGARIANLEAYFQKLNAQLPAPKVGNALDITASETTTKQDISGGPDEITTTQSVATVDNGLEPVNVITPGFSSGAYPRVPPGSSPMTWRTAAISEEQPRVQQVPEGYVLVPKHA